MLRRLGLVRRPAAVQWIVTSLCDLHCPHCYSSAGKRAEGELTTDEAKHLLVDQLVEMGCPLLVLAGGELLLRKDIPELIRYACSRGLDYAMHTHGRLVPRHRALFEAHPPVLAAISLDGPQAFHDSFRGHVGSFEDALAAMAVLDEVGCEEVVASTTVTRDNADLMDDLFPIIRDSAAHSWGIHLFAPEGRGSEHHRLLPTPDQLRRVAAYCRRKRQVFPVELCSEWGSAGDDDIFYRDEPFLCGAGRITCVVASNGHVMPCTTTDPRESEGSIRERPLSEIWAQGFQRFRSKRGEWSDGRECWLQARNGRSVRAMAFGRPARVSFGEARP